MTTDPERPELVDRWATESERLDAVGAMRWQFVLAYVLMILPIFYVGMSSHIYPVPRERSVTLFVMMGIAVGAGLYVVRRQPRNVLGWIGFLAWGGFCLLLIISSLTYGG